MDTTFLIIDGILIEDLEADHYKAYKRSLGKYLRMIAGNLVYEMRGDIWVIEADFSDIDNDTLKILTDAMGVSEVHQISFLPSIGTTELHKSQFFLTERAAPSLSSWTNPIPEWSNYAMTFEEIKPHD